MNCNELDISISFTQFWLSVSSNLIWKSQIHSIAKHVSKKFSFLAEPVAFSHLLNYWLFTNPKSILIYNTASKSGVVLLNPLSVSSTKSSQKSYVSSTIQTSLTFFSLFLTIIWWQIFSSFIDTSMAKVPRKSGIIIIPDPLRRVQTTRSSTHSHPFHVSLPNPRTLSHKFHFFQEFVRYGTPYLFLPPLIPTICLLSNLTSTNLILSPSLPSPFFFLCWGLCYRPLGLSPRAPTKR